MKKVLIALIILFSLTFSIGIYADVPPVDSSPEISDNKGWLSGRVIWDGHALTKASVQVFKDPKLKELYTKGLILDKEGIYALEMDDPGTYYMSAFVDDNDNNKFDTGDGMGLFGVTDWSDLDQKAVPIKIEKGKKLLDIDIEITAIVNERGQVVPISTNQTDLTTGISGKLVFPDYKFTKTIVYAYSDPLWNNKIAQTDVLENGEYALKVPAGLYYLMAIIDENNSNLLDVGDKFGVFGMTRFGMVPRPIRVSAEKVRINRNILMIGKIDTSGKPVPLQNAVSEISPTVKEENLTLSGKVIWIGHDVKNSVIQAYTDPSMTVAVAKANVDNKGDFNISLPPGEYYLTAGVDADGNGKYTKGDGIGVYGTQDATNEPPKKLVITKDSQNEQINLTITAEFDNSGQLQSIVQEEQTEPENKTEQVALVDTGSPFTGVSGKIIWTAHKLSNVILIFSEDPSFNEGIRVPLNLSEDGVYACSAAPGIHFLMAIVDNNANGQSDTGDGIGFYGAGYIGNGKWGTPQTVTVIENITTPYVNISITAILDADKKPVMTRDGVKAYYGNPNNVFNTTSDTQEWWYWSKGVSFTFSKTDDEWVLTDIYEFTPKDIQSDSPKDSKGIIYYTLEDNIWSVNPDGTNQNRIAPGRNVTGTLDGAKLLFLDSYSGLSIFSPYNQTLTELDWKQTGSQQALSNDGKTVALTRDINGRKHIAIMNIETGNETSIPGENLDFSCPAWSPDGELLAYSASLPLSQDQQGKPNRDIYYYDLVAKRTERISTSPQDEFDPAWSPGDARMLVFSRSEETHAQLWLVRFDANGKPSEQQLTKHGGRSPAWSPDGDKIIYENNAQLWTIKPDGTNETPILVNNEPVFGLDPFWTK
jgi:hypothetical protein